MRKNLNNKGFSLVELIIVIAIMAILIGVLAPNLIRYVERTRVSSDTQIADNLRMAITTGLADPLVETTDIDPFLTESSAVNGIRITASQMGPTLLADVCNTLNVTAANLDALETAIVGMLRSRGASTAQVFVFTSSGNVTVWFTNTDSTGNRDPGKLIGAGDNDKIPNNGFTPTT